MIRLPRRGLSIAIFLALVAAPLSLTAPARAQVQKVVGIEVRGNQNVSAQAVLSAIKTKIGDDFSDTHIAEDERAIRRQGFYHEVHSLTEPAPGGVKVIFTVVENPRVTAIQITGNTKITTAKIQELLVTKVGGVFNGDVFEKDLTNIEKLYRDRGYGLARVTEQSDVSPDGVVKIPIAEGWIEAIKVEGCKKTKQFVVLREMETKPGEVFDSHKLQEDLTRLRNLDLFEAPTPEFNTTLGSEPGKVVLVVNCKEKKTGTVSVGAGYSSRDRLVGFAEISEHNFRGVNQDLSLRWEAGQYTNRSGYELDFNDPWLLGKRTSLGFQVYDRTDDEQVPAELNGDTWVATSRVGGAISVGRPIGKFDRLLFDLRSDNVKVSPIEGYAAPPIQDLSSNGRVTSLMIRGTHNTRNYDMDPKRGSLLSGSVQLAGGPLGGDWSFIKLGADLRHYFPIGRAKADGSNQKVVAMRLLAGAAMSRIPFIEEYVIGGSDTLRGYREDAFRGTRMLLYSAEFRVPFGPSIQGVTFFDAGYAWADGASFRIDDMQPAVGLGVRVVTPLGPLRLDYGIGRNGGRTHFAIGHVF